MTNNFFKIITFLSILIFISWLGFFYYVSQNRNNLLKGEVSKINFQEEIKKDSSFLDIYNSEPNSNNCSLSFSLSPTPTPFITPTPTPFITPTPTPTPFANLPMCRDMKFVIEKPNGSFSTNMSQISKGDTIYYTCNGSKDAGNYANFQLIQNDMVIVGQSRESLSTRYNSIFNSAGVSVSNEEYYWSYQIPNNAPDGSYFVECEVCDKDNNCTGLSN